MSPDIPPVRKIEPSDLFATEHLSYSRLNMFHTCPRMFELVYLCGHEDRSGRAAQLGQLIHKMVDKHVSGLLAGGDGSSTLGSGGISGIMRFKASPAAELSLEHTFAKAEIEPLLRCFRTLNHEAPIGDVLAVERTIESRCGNFELVCIIDRIDRSKEGKTKVIDYKTGKKRYVRRRQLEVYGYALTQMGERPDTLEYQYLGEQERTSWHFTDAAAQRAQSWLLETVEEIEQSDHFPRHTSGLCKYCGVRKHCDP